MHSDVQDYARYARDRRRLTSYWSKNAGVGKMVTAMRLDDKFCLLRNSNERTRFSDAPMCFCDRCSQIGDKSGTVSHCIFQQNLCMCREKHSYVQLISAFPHKGTLLIRL